MLIMTKKPEKKLNQIEHDIADKIYEQFRTKVQGTLGHITGDDGAINTNGMWGLKNNLIPKHTTRKSTAIRDSKGNLITNPEAIKQWKKYLYDSEKEKYTQTLFNCNP